MVTLFCFCCAHENPAGSQFCNGCGSPLHLKPCRACKAINPRAAAHCHQCGETFALFSALVSEGDAAPAAELVPVPANHEWRVSDRAKRAMRGGAAATATLVVVAISGIAYHASQPPPTLASMSATAPSQQPASMQAVTREAPSAPSTSPLSSPAPSSTVTIDAYDSAAVEHATDLAAPPALAPAVKANASGSRAVRKTAGASLPNAKTQAVRAQQPRIEADERRLATRSPRPHASQSRATAAVARHQSTSRPAPVAHETIPCAEGTMLSPSCDLRLLAKGN
ncbi:MAG TPA: zinc ribbon domain-containing protein [Casimicrobiaceae bacterium]|nr:zinc ribbon domain-containing protein [Casimicrobiaceae bacterium]